MKRYTPLLILAFFFLAITAKAQDKIPSIKVKDLNGNVVDASSLASNNGKPVVISFWATWCKPCVRELNAIKDQYIDWQDESGVKLIAISIDDSRNSAKVKPFITGQGWEYPVYLDENSELRRALNVNNIPHTFLLDGKGNIVWQHNGYIPGDEDHLYELITKVSKGEKIK
ncbi:MAG TPA: alkyl hydroperoxide reductase [Cryomorphaceae bacterium]|nr:alkyl hydroperoxide reductase [Owenweeksia sp.]MBF99879.1 alkyl hydroperoxide reductase [Owenweeksia sp.]HAD97685.1 alkyl hydroperoxide reductase [Cryomorphaceae bacterium]HBF21104.1 alkyl hydroperoxide reductase [Cryomorphaceae bacterium]